MTASFFDQIQVGSPAFDRDGHEIGTVRNIVREPPPGMSGYGFVEIEGTRPDGGVLIHLPLTAVLEVGSDRVVVELDPDLVASHSQQIKPEKAPD